MTLETAFANGQLGALRYHKLAWPAPTHPTVRNSAVLRAREPVSTPLETQQALKPPTTPFEVAQVFNAHEQSKTRIEPRRKLSANICTTCRKDKHYGPCTAPRKIPTKAADFNMGMRGDDPTAGDNPSTSPHYHAATTADSSLARARDGRPADEQAATGFADLFRHLGISHVADEPGRMTGGLHKVADTERTRRHAKLAATPPPIAPSPGPFSKAIFDSTLFRPQQGTMRTADWQMWGTDGHSMHEQRGPVNPYEERLTRKSPPVGWGDEGDQRIKRTFDQIDGAVDTTNAGGGFGDPQPGPAVLG